MLYTVSLPNIPHFGHRRGKTVPAKRITFLTLGRESEGISYALLCRLEVVNRKVAPHQRAAQVGA
jgi:hypothetical protein